MFNPVVVMNGQKDHAVKRELQLCPNLDLDLKPQKALRQRIRAFKQRQVEDLMNQYRKGQKNGADGGKAASGEPEEDAYEMPKKQEESKAAEFNKKEKSQPIEVDLAS